jgi:glycosyltransferase involved in cell wall biosynthesis
VTHSTANPPTPRARPPRRITFCITELDPGGAERQLVRLATHLDRSLFEPQVVCLAEEGPLAVPLRDAGIPVTCLGARGLRDFAAVLFRLRRHFRQTRPDLVQTFLFHANVAGRIAARAAGVRVVVSGLRVAERRRWHLRLDRLTDRLVDRHVCVSRAVAEYAAKAGGLPARKLVVIPNAVDVDSIAAAPPADLTEFGFPADAHTILFVGRLDEQKDPIRLIDAFRTISEKHPEARLLIVGQGPLESELRTRAARLGDRVHFAGRRGDVPSLLKAAACLALPSRWEGMPNVVLEAMAAGTPVVAGAAEGIGELLRDGAAGTIVHSCEASDFATALSGVLERPGAAAAQARLAQHIVITTFTTDAMVTEYRNLYLGLLER